MRARPHAKAERDVLEHGHVAEERVVLEDETDAAFADLPVRRILAVEQHTPAVGRLEPCDDAQQRGLAAARRPEQRHELARTDLEADVTECREVAELLSDASDVDAHG